MNNINTTEIHHPTSSTSTTTTSTSISASTNTSSTNTSSTTTVNVPLISLSLNEKYNHVVIALNEIETSLRLKYHPSLIERAAPLEVDDIKENAQKDKKEQEEQEDKQDNNQVHENNQNNQNSIQDEMKVKKEEEEENDSIVAKISPDLTEASIRRQNLKGSIEINQQMMMNPMNPTISMIDTKFNFNFIQILDVSNNEITELPGLHQLTNLQTINLNRNWFNTLPIEILQCTKIQTIIASRNFFKPNQESLLLQGIKTNLIHLKILDLQYNQKCSRIVHRERIHDILNTTTTTNTTTTNTGSPGSPGSSSSRSASTNGSRPQIQILMTLWEETIGTIPGTYYVGTNASCRTSTLLRSQLEPLGTVALRRRLVCDFHQLPSDPSTVNRSQVMTLLLKEYYKEQLAVLPTPTPTPTQPPNDNDDDDEKKNDNDNNENDERKNENDDSCKDYDSLLSNRKTLYLEGTPVSQMKINEIMIELRKWTNQTGLINKNRERPSIKAQNYMILRKLITTKIENNDNNDNDNNNKNKYSNKSRRAIRKAKKQDRYRIIWDLAITILSDIDPNYADQHCTEIAVTYGFKGSPHIDKQNCGPFYGLCMGTFGNGNGNGSGSGGGGGIIVESSARTCININTHNKLAKIDGRYVHWVDEWDTTTTTNNTNTTTTDTTTTNSTTDTSTDIDATAAAAAAAAAGLPVVERYSLIYYETGNNFMKPGPAVFSIPKENRNQL